MKDATLMAPFHDWMPAILWPENHSGWLDTRTDPEVAAKVMRTLRLLRG